MNQSRKDDLEALGYTILSLLVASPEEVDFLNVSKEALENGVNDNLHLS